MISKLIFITFVTQVLSSVFHGKISSVIVDRDPDRDRDFYGDGDGDFHGYGYRYRDGDDYGDASYHLVLHSFAQSYFLNVGSHKRNIPIGSFVRIHGTLNRTTNTINVSKWEPQRTFRQSQRTFRQPQRTFRQPQRTFRQSQRIFRKKMTRNLLGVFYMNMTGNACGLNGVQQPCQHCFTNIDQIHNIFYKDSNKNVKDFYVEVSDGLVNFTVDSTTIFNVNNITEGPTDLYESVDSIIKDKIGVNVKDFDFVVFIFPWNWNHVPPLNSFLVRGVAETGGTRSWIITCRMDTILHELGHNFNFGHANAFNEKGEKRFCADSSSVMGCTIDVAKRGINSIHRYRAGWLKEEYIIRPKGIGSWKLHPLSVLNDTAAIILEYDSKNHNDTFVPAKDSEQYFIEYRERISYDGELGYSRKNVLPQGRYYNTILILQLDILTSYYNREDTSLLAVLELNEEFSIENRIFIKHSVTNGNVSISTESSAIPVTVTFPAQAQSTASHLVIYIVFLCLMSVIFT